MDKRNLKEFLENAEVVDFFSMLSEEDKRISDMKGKIAAEIISARYDLRLNQKQLADLLGVPAKFIFWLEDGDYDRIFRGRNRVQKSRRW